MKSFLLLVVVLVFSLAGAAQSIGGPEHNAEIYGVKIGMDVPSALEAVFRNAEREPGQEKPDALRREGKNNEDIRVVYNDLPAGELQIVFAKGKIVREIVLAYRIQPKLDDLRLPYSGDIGVAMSGQRFDDRYTIGFLDSKKQQKLWWRDESTDGDYMIRVSFASESILRDGNNWWQTIILKAVSVRPGDEEKFLEAIS